MTFLIIFEIANWKVQIENFIFPIFIFQLFRTFFETQFPAVIASTEGAKQSVMFKRLLRRDDRCN
ncbi:MAG: hypothetical protein COS94_00720 [Candidatus Hydrogenedentes bacterium CG07_land_8_20_14_0_80_42_17]|nr:MAG: hypothetical protein COS94_00720 [Candidatus Hydrogenedentes bacterium CG07_land_8_20_14_0_80_42_17]